MNDTNVGLCGCGCGRPTAIAKKTNTQWGHVKGQPLRFLRGHTGGPDKDNRALLTRFMEKVDPNGPGGCWLWTGGLSNRGYGQMKVGDFYPVVHRTAYELLVGPIPEGLTLDHLCRVRYCVNPAHLEPVTMRENILRGTAPTAINARKTHCKKGHPYSGDNLIVRHGHRLCRTCERDRHRRDRLRKAA